MTSNSGSYGCDLMRWVNDNNPPPTAAYGKGWWDWVENIRQLARLIASPESSPSRTREAEVFVVGTITYETPPPSESITMPVVCLRNKDFHAYIAWCFSFEPNWPSYLVAIENYSLDEEGLDQLDRVLDYQAYRQETDTPRRSMSEHTLATFQRFLGRCKPDEQAFLYPPFFLDAEALLDKSNVALTFETFHSQIGDSSFFNKNALLFSAWNIEDVYMTLTTIQVNSAT